MTPLNDAAALGIIINPIEFFKGSCFSIKPEVSPSG